MPLELSAAVENVVRKRAAAEGVSVEELLARTFAPEKTPIREVADPRERVRQLLSKWRAEDDTPTLSPILLHNGETPTKALFQKWKEEDARLTDAEREREAKFWEEFQEDVDGEREILRMRTLF